MTHPSISAATAKLLRLSFLPGVGTVALRKIVSLAQRGELDALDDDELVARVARPGGKSGKQNHDGWAQVLAKCKDEGIHILSPLDTEFPSLLASIDDYPPILYVKGDLAALSLRAAAVVGTREASKIGLSWARQIAEIFAQHQFCVVSGLALGIDTAGHEGALKAAGATIAVLAHGLDQVTPASNRPLARAILDNGGALISEHPPGVPPRRQEYVRRNRIQSGLSVCSVVVESGESGGAIHQGNFTHQQGRRLFCVLPDPGLPGAEDFRFEGAHRLMREAAAIPLHTRGDLLQRLQGELSQPAREPSPEKQPSLPL